MSSSGGTFFGLIVKPNKRYDTTVKETFRITKACLEPSQQNEKKTTSLHVEYDNEEYIIANLDSKHLNEPLDLGFTKGEKIAFKVEGPGVVHVTGNIQEEDDESFMDGDMMMGEEESESEEEEVEAEPKAGKRKKEGAGESPAKKVKTAQPVNGKDEESSDDSSDDEDDSSSGDGPDTSLGDLDDTDNFAAEEDSDDDSDGDDDDSDDDSSEEESSPAKPAPQTNGKEKKKLNGSAKETPKKEGKSPKKEAKTPKQEVKTPKQEVKTPKQDVKTPKQDAKTPKQDAKTPKQEGKTPKQDGKTPKAEAKTPKQEGKTPKADAAATPKSVKKTMKGGIAIEEIKEGTGPECKSGKQIGMYYSGRLKSNNKQFDACQSGKPFKFKLGKGEVIKGWDLGLQGLKVGGKRKITIPPQMGYGAAGAPPDIPPNSTLVFEVECKYVN